MTGCEVNSTRCHTIDSVVVCAVGNIGVKGFYKMKKSLAIGLGSSPNALLLLYSIHCLQYIQY